MPTARRPTMRDVAERAGVSFKTVSRVVNGEAGVSPELTARVEQAVADLDYRPDHRARLLRSAGAGAGTIGFVLVDVANPFSGNLLRGIEEIATERNSLVLAGSSEGSPERVHQLIEAFVGRRVDGLIVVSSEAGSGPLRSELERGTPVVFLDLEPDVEGIDLVRSDHYRGAVIAVEHLIAHGHTDIAYFGDDPGIFSGGLRLEGYRDAMSAAGLTAPEDRIVTGTHSVEVWFDIVRSHLNTNGPPSAMFTAQNYVTLGAVQALHDADLQHRVALVGFDEVELGAVVDPAITVIPQHPRQLGRRAAEVLFDRIGGRNGPPIRDVLSFPLVPRGSGEVAPSP